MIAALLGGDVLGTVTAGAIAACGLASFASAGADAVRAIADACRRRAAA